MEINDIDSYTVIDFYDKPILALHSTSLGYIVPMIKIVEDDLELHWEKQREKITNSRMYNPVIVKGIIIDQILQESTRLCEALSRNSVYSRNSSYSCLPLDEVGIFLSQINLNSSHKRSKEVLYRYHAKCAVMMSNHLKSIAELNKFKHTPSMLL